MPYFFKKIMQSDKGNSRCACTNIYEPVSQFDSPTIYMAFWSSIRRFPALHAILHQIFQSKMDRDTQKIRMLSRVGSGVRRKNHEPKLSSISNKTLHRIEQNLIDELAPPQIEPKLNVAMLLSQETRSVSIFHKYVSIGSGSKLQNRIQMICNEDQINWIKIDIFSCPSCSLYSFRYEKLKEKGIIR